MTLQQQYIQNLRDIMTDMVHRVMTNPGSPWIQPPHTPLMDGYNRPFSGLSLLAVTYFRQKNRISSPFFCHAYQRKLFKQPLFKDELGVPVLKKDGEPTCVYPCNIQSNRLNDKTRRMEQNQKMLFSKMLMRMHHEKFSPINDEGITHYIYKDITKNMPSTNEMNSIIAEISAAVVALELGLPKNIEPQNIKFLSSWNQFLHDDDIDLEFVINSVSQLVENQSLSIRKTEIKEHVFKNNLTDKIRNLATDCKGYIPRVKTLSEMFTPSIKIK